MSTVPHDSDLSDIFGHFLDYQNTEAFKDELEAREQERRIARRPINRKGSQTYRRVHADLVNMRQRAEKHRIALFEQQKGRCYHCKSALDSDYEIDHIKALVKGGTNELSNLCVCCRTCNRRKGTR